MSKKNLKKMDSKKIEAIARMEKLGIHRGVIDAFQYKDIVYIHEPQLSILFEPEEEDLERIRQFEAEHNALVYLVIRSYTNYGMMDSMLYVRNAREEWYMDRAGLADPDHWRQEAYVYNHEVPRFSEIGLIGLSAFPENTLHLPHRIW